MTILFTSNMDGGMLHFCVQLLLVHKKLNKEAVVFLPKGSVLSVPEGLEECFEYYEKFRTIRIGDARIKALKERMKSYHPDIIWYGDSSILSMQMSIVFQKECKQVLSLHDAGAYHPTNHISIKERLQRKYTDHLLLRSMQALDKVLVLSPSCEKTFLQNYPAFREKCIMIPLGATMPEVKEEKPSEWEEGRPYFLFFGRIDKYKGIARICEAYHLLEEEKIPLVIAGGGAFTEEEEALIGKDDGIHTIHRYIPDGEMQWLVKNARALVLPYIEATQSGVLPIAYHYGKPAITSDEPGLTQFMENRKTGYICSDTEEYKNALRCLMQEEESSRMGKNAAAYYEEHLSWENNIARFFEKI